MPEITPDVERELAALDDALAGRRVAPDLTELGELALLLRDERPEPDPAFGPTAGRAGRTGVPGPGPPSPCVRAALVDALAQRAGARHGGGGRDRRGGARHGVQRQRRRRRCSNGAETSASGAQESAESARRRPGPRRLPAPRSTKPRRRPPARPGGDDCGHELLRGAAAEPRASRPPGNGSPGSDGRDRRSIERSASLTLAARPREIDNVSARIQDVTRRQGGFVVSSTVNSSTGGGDGTFELRIPARNLDAAMAALSRLGKVRERSQRSQDITAAVVSARSRLKDARTERKSLLRQLAAATTLTATQAIRARLSIVSREIEQARAGRAPRQQPGGLLERHGDADRGRQRRCPRTRTTTGRRATRRTTRCGCSRSPPASR